MSAPGRSVQSEILRLIAPCGLYCGGCLAFVGGPVRNHARALHELLGTNLEAYSKRMEAMNPVLCHYADFSHLLEFLSRGACEGCRQSGCLLGNCKARDCVVKRGVDFCGLCPDFPCAEPGLPEDMAERWRANGRLLRKLGPVAFLEYVRTLPRRS